jgi:hypothetical protein
LIGIAVFAIGVAMYVADLWLTRQRRGPKDPKPMAG